LREFGSTSGDARNGTAFSAVAPSQRPAFATHQSNMSGMAFIPPEYPHGNARPLDWFRSGLQRILLGIFGLIRARPFAREEGGIRGAISRSWCTGLMIPYRSIVSRLLAAHPLQVHAGRNQLQPLLVTMTDGELPHARRLLATCRAAPHPVRAWRGTLLDREVREFPGEASIVAVLPPKLLNLFPTFLPVHSCSPCRFGTLLR
jgi:hypothetical protein